MQNFRCLGDRHSRHRSWHVKQRSFIKGRHEFAAESFVRENCNQKNDEGTAKREPTITQNEVGKWLIGPDQKSVHRIFFFRCDFPADEQRHQHRHERDAEERCEEHRESFCEGQGTEKTTLLCSERENRDKTYCDYEQSEKQRAADVFCSSDDYLNTLGVVGLTAMYFAKVLKLLMRVLDHDDR